MNKDELLSALETIHDTICDIQTAKGRVHQMALRLVEELQTSITKEEQ